MTKASEAKHWIDKNLWAILAVGLGLYGGYLTGQTTTTMRIEQLEKDVATNSSRLEGRRDFMVCAVRTIDRLVDRTGIEKPCPLDVKK